MKKFISKHKKKIIFIGVVMLYLLILSIIDSFNLLTGFFSLLINIVFSIVLFFFTGYRLSKKKDNKGWYWGLKNGLILIVIFFFLSLIFRCDLSFKVCIYYLILLISSILGGMFGIAKKKP